MIIRTTTEHTMKLKQKRQIALTHFVNTIYTLDDHFQKHISHILSIEALDLSDEKQPFVSTIEHVYYSIFNITYAFAKSHSHLIDMLKFAIEFNEKHKLEYSQEFLDTLKARIDFMNTNGIFGKSFNKPILDAGKYGLRSAITTLDDYLAYAATFKAEASSLIDLSLFDYRFFLYDPLYIKAHTTLQRMDMTRFEDLKKHTEKFNEARAYLKEIDDSDFGISDKSVDDFYPSEARLRYLNKTEIDRRTDEQMRRFHRQSDGTQAAQQRELAEMFEYIEGYCFRNFLADEWMNGRVKPAFFELDKRGDIQYGRIIYYLTDLINEAADSDSIYRHYKISGQRMLDIQTFSYFIIRVAEMET